jgi:hypothetical protein
MKIPKKDAIMFLPNGLLAQLVEHIVHIDGVTGSSPVQTTTICLKRSISDRFLHYIRYQQRDHNCDFMRSET